MKPETQLFIQWIISGLSLLAIIIIGARDIFWGRRQKEYYDLTSPKSVLGDLKALQELLKKATKERDEYKEMADKVSNETSNIIEASESGEETVRGLDFTELEKATGQLHSLTGSPGYETLSEALKGWSQQMKGLSKTLSEIPRIRLTEDLIKNFRIPVHEMKNGDVEQDDNGKEDYELPLPPDDKKR